MNQLRSKPFRQYLPRTILALSLAGIYASTLAPGLTWANAGSDGGDLIAAAATGGIAHPTGYPLYLLLARLFQLLPFGSLAFRTNLMSALFTVLGALLVYGLVARCSAREAGVPAWPGGLAAGYAFGLAPLVWSQALITEVYALQAFLLLLVLHVYTDPPLDSSPNRKRLDAWRGVLLGLAACNHITALFLAPPALLLGSLRRKPEAGGIPGGAQRWLARLRLERSALRRQLAWFGVGLCVYSILPLRALAQPPVNWGNPVSLGRFWWLVSGQLYQGHYLPESLAGLGARAQAWAALLLEQFGWPGLMCGFLGLVLFGRVSRLVLLSTWMALVFSVFALFYRSPDSYVYLIPVYISFALWIGMGISGLARATSQRTASLGLVLGVLMSAYFLARSATNFRLADASQDLRAEDFGREVLSAAPEQALVFAKGDQAVFALWYFHFALGDRTDLAVLASDLLHFDWYQDSLQASYPSLILPGPFPFPETITLANPSRAVCYVQYTDRAVIDCKIP